MLGSSLWEPPSDRVATAFWKFNTKCSLEYFKKIQQDVRGNNSDSGIKWVDGAKLACCISEKIQQRQPASFVRLSDGEGNIVALKHDFGASAELIDWCARRISYIHFGDHTVIGQDYQFFSDVTCQAFENADLIGFSEFSSVLNSFSVPDDRKDIRAIFGNMISLLYLEQRAKNNPPFIGSSAWFSRNLLPYYREIIREAPRFCIISSYSNLPTKLSLAFGVPSDDITYIEVPVQAVFVETKKRQDTLHFPRGMERIVHQIREACTDYQVVFVAAGLLGKHYCNLVKNCGSIAIDIGSVAEIWLGIPARGMDQNFIDRWKL